MALFPPVEHREYRNTFLVNTFVVLNFEKRSIENCGESIRRNLTDFLRDTYLTEGNHNYPSEGLQLSRSDNRVAFEYTPTLAVARVSQGAYTTFAASMIPEVYKLRRFVFGVLGIEKVQRVDVRKISIFPMQIEGEEPTSESLNEHLSMILSEDVLSLMPMDEIEGPSGSIGKFTRYRMADDETGYRYMILVGMVKDSEREHIYNVILDATCYYTLAAGITEAKLEELLRRMNQSVYELYHWSVRDHVLEFMNRDLGHETGV